MNFCTVDYNSLHWQEVINWIKENNIIPDILNKHIKYQSNNFSFYKFLQQWCLPVQFIIPIVNQNCFVDIMKKTAAELCDQNESLAMLTGKKCVLKHI